MVRMEWPAGTFEAWPWPKSMELDGVCDDLVVYNGKGADTLIITGLTTDICSRHTAFIKKRNLKIIMAIIAASVMEKKIKESPTTIKESC